MHHSIFDFVEEHSYKCMVRYADLLAMKKHSPLPASFQSELSIYRRDRGTFEQAFADALRFAKKTGSLRTFMRNVLQSPAVAAQLSAKQKYQTLLELLPFIECDFVNAHALSVAESYELTETWPAVWETLYLSCEEILNITKTQSCELLVLKVFSWWLNCNNKSGSIFAFNPTQSFADFLKLAKDIDQGCVRNDAQVLLELAKADRLKDRERVESVLAKLSALSRKEVASSLSSPLVTIEECSDDETDHETALTASDISGKTSGSAGFSLVTMASN